MTFVVVVLLSVFQLFVFNDSVVALSDQKAQANQLARRHLERQMSMSYDAVASVDGVEKVSHAERRGSALSTEFTYRVEVSQPDASKNLKNLRVVVQWGNNPQHEVVLESVKGELW